MDPSEEVPRGSMKPANPMARPTTSMIMENFDVKGEEDDQWPAYVRVIVLVSSVIGIILVLFAITVMISKYQGQWQSVSWLLNGEKPFRVRTLLLAMLSALTFGFVDNAGLFFGMDALDSYLPGGELTRAGWGNTFSDGIGAFIGAFVGKIVMMLTGFDGGPIYADFVGIVIGCILGIYIPKFITGKE